MKSLVLFFATLITVSSFGQHIIKGSISDANGTLPLANIIIKNTSTGVFSDDYGNFIIDAKPSDTLEISYLGYKTKEVGVGKQTAIKVVLDDHEELDEVTVLAYRYSRIACSGNRITVSIIDDYKDSNLKKVMLYPNPSKDGIFNIKLLEDVSEVNIIVADITGRIIINKTQSQVDSSINVDLSKQPSGIYIINVSSNGTQIASRKAIRI